MRLFKKLRVSASERLFLENQWLWNVSHAWLPTTRLETLTLQPLDLAYAPRPEQSMWGRFGESSCPSEYFGHVKKIALDPETSLGWSIAKSVAPGDHLHDLAIHMGEIGNGLPWFILRPMNGYGDLHQHCLSYLEQGQREPFRPDPAVS